MVSRAGGAAAFVVAVERRREREREKWKRRGCEGQRERMGVVGRRPCTRASQRGCGNGGASWFAGRGVGEFSAKGITAHGEKEKEKR